MSASVAATDRLVDDSVDVGRIILGGPYGREPERVSFAKLDLFHQAGGRLVETSYSYANGRSKEVLGTWLGLHPGALGVVTKVGHNLSGGDIALDRKLVEAHVDETRGALGLDTLDVLMYHCDDPLRSVAELADTLRELVASGRTRRVGVSNWSPDRLASLAEEFGEHAGELVASYHFSLAAADAAGLAKLGLSADGDILGIVRAHDMSLVSWSAQAQGYFSRAAPRQPDGLDPFDTPRSARRRERATELAERINSRPDVVALAWTLHQRRTWATIGPSSTAQLESSLGAARVDLSQEQAAWLLAGDADAQQED